LLLLVAVSAFLTYWFWPWGNSGLNPQEQLRPVVARGELAGLEQTSIEIYERASPSLVQVTKLAQAGSFAFDVQQVPQGVGSGFVWDEDGHIVTNYHVVERADNVRVTLSDHSTLEAQDLWVYPDQDIAVLSVRATKGRLRPIAIGSSHDLKVGQLCFALGDPFGLDQTMTMGIVSALGRRIQAANGHTIEGVIQTSAAINPGNSGGPLLDSAGRLIGMNTAILSPSGAFAGIGFAIPIDDINQIVTQLIRHGKIVRPALAVLPIPEQTARGLGIREGVLIGRVWPNGTAAEAGLKGTRRDEEGNIYLGDVVVAIDGKPVRNLRDLNEIMQQHEVGDKVTITIVRDTERQDVQATLRARPQ
jgi:S1-C subfamily serine protease